MPSSRKRSSVDPVCSHLPDSWPTPGLQTTIDASREFFAGKRALVTGAFGFVGGHLARALVAAGVTVTALDLDASHERGSQLNLSRLREQMEVVEADITHREHMRDIVRDGKFDFIFHIAAGATTIEKAISDPYSTILANTMGFVNLAEGARLLPKEERPVILYSSTDKVYGESDELPYVEEKTNLGGVGVYDAAKLAADIFAGTYHKALGVPTIVLRMCNLFGPYDFNFNYRLVPKAMRNIFRDREAPELYLNALEHFRDYLYVEDAARAFMHLAMHEKCRGRVYNLPGAHYSATPDVLREVVELVGKMQDSAREIDPESALATMKWNRSIRVVQSDPSLIVISKQHLDGSRIGREAGFEPETTFQEGLKRTALFYHWYFTEVAPEPPARSDVHHSDEPIVKLVEPTDEPHVESVLPPGENGEREHIVPDINEEDDKYSLKKLSQLMED
ncbi:MAG TPA: NAD(P)-dependent oxidoreductase [Abditibacteriaceae bacterium]|jgi:nucleoside-diphosphate-sugar epimerase